MDVDRRALENVAALTKKIDKNQLDAVIKSILVEGSHERLKVWWELLDRDGDGMLEEEEMNKVVELYQSPIKSAINEFTVAAISNLPEDKAKKIGTKAHKKYLNKLLKRTMSRCYEIEQVRPRALKIQIRYHNHSNSSLLFLDLAGGASPSPLRIRLGRQGSPGQQVLCRSRLRRH